MKLESRPSWMMQQTWCSVKGQNGLPHPTIRYSNLTLEQFYLSTLQGPRNEIKNKPASNALHCEARTLLQIFWLEMSKLWEWKGSLYGVKTTWKQNSNKWNSQRVIQWLILTLGGSNWPPIVEGFYLLGLKKSPKSPFKKKKFKC